MSRIGTLGTMTTEQWYWCLTHERVESAEERDRPDNAMGPYPSPEAARDWKALVEERNEAWKQADEEWEGTDEDEDDGI